MPGKVGEVVNTIIAATDDGDDPANWILEQIIAKMPSGTVKTLLNGARPFVAGYLNDRLLQFAPDFVATMVQIGNDFGQMAKNFGTNETLDVTGARERRTLVGRTRSLGAHFKIDDVESDLAFADYQVANVVVARVGITLDATGKLGIADHKVAARVRQDPPHRPRRRAHPDARPERARTSASCSQHQVDCNAVGTLDDALADRSASAPAR